MGPKAEQYQVWEEFMLYILRDHIHWRKNYFPSDNAIFSRADIRENENWIDKMGAELDKVLSAFKQNNPIYSPRYLAHMVSEQTLPSVLGYIAGMLYNSNNVSGESSPAAVPMELEVGKMIATMLGYDADKSWTHLTSGGTIANIEAMWVARTVKFMPFMVQEFCVNREIAFRITTPNGEKCDIRECPNRVLLALGTDEAIHVVRNLTRCLVEENNWDLAEAVTTITSEIKESKFNIIKVGLTNILNTLGVKPVILASPSAHYSIKKAANLLGYGEIAVRTIEVDNKFRMNADKLKEVLVNLPEDEYVAAVIAISGTTEEGAIDPIHKIAEVRDELSKEHNRSFWLHIDSAWGGYLRSLFCGYDVKNPSSIDEYRDAINEQFVGSTFEEIWKSDPQVYKALMSFPLSDSVTIDPHKMGYTPYPAGIVSFRNSIVTEHIKQEATYVFVGQREMDYNVYPDITEVGSYILEGSKPGAAAASCYLAHKTIPLTLYGHGKIVKSSLQSTIRLQHLMRGHLNAFENYCQKAEDKMRRENISKSGKKFTIIPLHRSDCNLICYVVRQVLDNGEVDGTVSLEDANKLNKGVFQRMGIDHADMEHSNTFHDYFVSKTLLLDSMYKYESIADVLKSLKVSKEEYQKHGLYVLRTTVMNPFYPLAKRKGKDYLDEFVTCIHANAEAELNK